MNAEDSTLGPIVVGTDGSVGAGKAVAEAVRLAVLLGVELHLVYASDLKSGPLRVSSRAGGASGQPMPEEVSEQLLDDAAAAATVDGLVVKQHSADGDPAEALIKVADWVGAHMIVVGSRGMHGIQRVLGSVPNTVAHSARCNVLVVATDND